MAKKPKPIQVSNEDEAHEETPPDGSRVKGRVKSAAKNAPYRNPFGGKPK